MRLAPSLFRTRSITGAAIAFGWSLNSGCGPQAPDPGALAGWNVVLVTIDTLRADRLGFSGWSGAQTPVMDRLAAEGAVFEDAIAAGPVTLPSHATILTGLYPPAHGALDNGFYSLSEGVPTLATALGDAGWQTAAFIGAAVLDGRYGLNRGFDVYDDAIHERRGTGQAYRERRAEVVVERAVRWLSERGDGTDAPSVASSPPFFAWLHFYDPHAPYIPVERLKPRFANAPYDGEIAACDEAIGVLLAALRRLSLREKTLIVITSDHGEAFGDGGELSHGLLLRQSTLKIPLVIHAPDVIAPHRVVGTVSNADIAPTVLELLGVPLPERLDGRSLRIALGGRDNPAARAVYSETRLPEDEYGWSMLAGARDTQWAYVKAPRPELYALSDDPSESTNRYDDDPERAAALSDFVDEVLAREVGAQGRASLDREELEALRSLGYVFSKEPPKLTGADPKDMIGVVKEINDIANLLERGQNEDVVTRAERVLADHPGNRELELFLAQALDRLGRTDEAIAAARRAFEAGGSLDLDGTMLAMFLMKAGQVSEAEALLRQFAKTEPDFAEHSFNLGNLLSHLQRYDEAAAAYERAHETDPTAVHILANWAATLSRLGADARGRSLEIIDRAISLAVEDDRPQLIKIEICERLGRKELGLETARRLQDKPSLSNVTEEEVADAVRELRRN